MKSIFLAFFFIANVYGGVILHMSDFHLDLEYKEGSYANCLDVDDSCCHKVSIPLPGSPRASRYGEKRCGSPKELLIDTFASLKKYYAIHPEFKPSMIVYTGDTFGNHVANVQSSKVFEYIDAANQYLSEAFPDIPIIYCPGNHDTFPINQFTLSRSMMTKNWYNSWKSYIPEDQVNTFLEGGYYSYSPIKGLRFISINTLWGDNQSVGLIPSDADPMLNWIHETLDYSRKNNEKVYWVSHWSLCQGDYNKYITNKLRPIFDEYNDIIIASLAGHIHAEDTMLYRHSNWEKMLKENNTNIYTHVSLFASSFKPQYTPTNLKFIIFNNTSFEIEDIKSLNVNKEESNKNRTIIFNEPLSYKNELKLSSFSPRSFGELSERINNDQSLLNRFEYFHSKYEQNCDEKCKQDLLNRLYC
ncbi:hypothetical protein WA158_001207 [Blastocystis sp. Blastoise]